MLILDGGLKMEQNQLPVADLLRATKEELLRAFYTELILIGIERVWRNLQHYMNERGIEFFNREIGEAFLKSYYSMNLTHPASSIDQVRKRALDLLSDYQNHQRILIRRKRKYYQFAPQFEKAFDDFIQFRKDSGLSSRTMESTVIYMERFSTFLNDQGVGKIADVQSAQVVDFFQHLGLKYSVSTAYCTASVMRSLFHYLHQENQITTDIAWAVPKIRCDKTSKIPSAYSQDEIQQLLATVDRGNPKGKRDYAMLIIAIRLGLRAADICNLTFDHLKWETNSIEFEQQKTGKRMTLPLLGEVGDAIIDYLKYGRPPVNTNVIFLRLSAPIEPMKPPTLHSIVTYYMNKAKIPIPAGKKHGPHALRHSLASALLNQNTPMPVISEVLGHSDSKTTSVYLKIDILQLRFYSLQVPPVQSFGFVGGEWA